MSAQIHETAHRLALATLSARLRLSRAPAYADLAWIGAWRGLVSSSAMRRAAAVAIHVLGGPSNAAGAWRFAWDWWYQQTADGSLAYQADLLTTTWAEEYVAAPDALPTGGCILVSVHHHNQRLGFLRLSSLVEQLGAVADFEPLLLDDPNLAKVDQLFLDADARLRALSRFSHRVFGPRMYPPRVAARHGLQLLRNGGSLIALPDFYGQERACLFGRRIPVPNGAIWWAQRSGRPIVPFIVSRVHGRWRLWCGDPVPATREALIQALEECIRRSPTAWLGWVPWHDSPTCTMR